ncbi:MAG: hypothetical protein WCF85_13510 [Rhodospirillaceae bacterium]
MTYHATDIKDPKKRLRVIRPFLLALFSTIISFTALHLLSHGPGEVFFMIDYSSHTGGEMQFFFDYGGGFSELNSTRVRTPAPTSESQIFSTYRVLLPHRGLRQLRYDPIDRQGDFVLRNPRIANANGTTLKLLSLQNFHPAHDIASCDNTDSKMQLNCIANGADPIIVVDNTSDWPHTAKFTKYVHIVSFAFGVITVVSIVMMITFCFSLIVLSKIRRLALLHPKACIIIVGITSVILSCYPVVFMGSSLVSPGIVPTLLYPNLPSLPGYTGERVENSRGSDTGSMLWAILPNSAVQSRAVAAGEFPLWNRDNSAGLPLVGQGQSMVFDPLHWITIFGNSNGWAWDMKFLASRAILVIGVGLAVFAATGSLPASLFMCTSSSYIGYFAYRINHPENFSLTYAPLILFFWFRVIQGFQWRNTRTMAEAKGSPWLAMIGLAVTSVLQLGAGAPKEGATIFLAVQLTGFIAFVLSPERIKEKAFPLACLCALGVAIVLISAPIWLVFLDTLSHATTMYDVPSANFAQLWYFSGVFDPILFEQITAGGLTYPSLNIFVLICLLWVLVRFHKLCRDRLFIACLAGTVVAGSVAFGLIPASIFVKLPLFGKIQHVGQTVLDAFCILALVLAGFGIRDFLETSPAKRRLYTVFTSILLAACVGLFYLSAATNGATFSGGWISWLIAAVMIVAALGAMVSACLLLQTKQVTWLIVLGLCLGAMHLRHGYHTFTGSSALDDHLINVPSRADFSVPSPAIEKLRRMPGPYRTIGEFANLFPGFNAFLGIESINSPDAVFSSKYIELLDALGIVPINDWQWLRLVTAQNLPKVAAGLDLLNVRYVLATPGTLPPVSLTVAARADLDVWVRDSAWPRAFFVNGEAHYKQVAELAGFAETAAGRPFAAVQVMEQPPISPEPGRVIISAHDYQLTTNGTRFTIDASEPGMVVLTETFWPDDIHVTVNGLAAEAVRVNHAFRGVRLDRAGRFEIHFWYEPRYWKPSIAMALVGFGMLVFAAWLGRRWRRSEVAQENWTGR